MSLQIRALYLANISRQWHTYSTWHLHSCLSLPVNSYIEPVTSYMDIEIPQEWDICPDKLHHNMTLLTKKLKEIFWRIIS